jgi:hypothetical protein
MARPWQESLGMASTRDQVICKGRTGREDVVIDRGAITALRGWIGAA